MFKIGDTVWQVDVDNKIDTNFAGTITEIEDSRYCKVKWKIPHLGNHPLGTHRELMSALRLCRKCPEYLKQ